LFTGIIEAKSDILQVIQGDQSLKIVVAQPSQFSDLRVGDSIACNGVCLTVESFDGKQMVFTIGYETLQVTGWTAQALTGASINLERSLRFGDRIHGHLVSGHVDAVAELTQKSWQGDCLILSFSLPQQLRSQVWKKSSIAINGVSLTVNEVNELGFSVCLIPETLRQTQLESLNTGDTVNLETDYYMKGLLQAQINPREYEGEA
jgi:riboflavin synthase